MGLVLLTHKKDRVIHYLNRYSLVILFFKVKFPLFELKIFSNAQTK